MAGRKTTWEDRIFDLVFEALSDGLDRAKALDAVYESIYHFNDITFKKEESDDRQSRKSK